MMIAQIMNQTRLQQSFHEDLRATQTLLQNITNAAIYLQATIGDAQSAFNTFSLWRGPLISIVWWSWCAMTFCIYAIFKIKLIVYVIFICGKYYPHYTGNFSKLTSKQYAQWCCLLLELLGGFRPWRCLPLASCARRRMLI